MTMAKLVPQGILWLDSRYNSTPFCDIVWCAISCPFEPMRIVRSNFYRIWCHKMSFLVPTLVLFIISLLIQSRITFIATCIACNIHSFIHSFVWAFVIAPLQDFYSEALPTTARTLNRSFTPKRMSNCEWRTCPGSLRGGLRWIRTRNPTVCKAPNIPLHRRAPYIGI